MNAQTHRPKPGETDTRAGLVLGRDLTAEDVETARGLLEQHQPTSGTVQLCASAMHQIDEPEWPCDRFLWAEQVLAACARGEIADGGEAS